jgi:putative membrane protein
MRRLLSQIIAAALGLWLAVMFVHGIVIRTFSTSNFFGFHLAYPWEIILLLGIALGLINYFLKPLLKTLRLPLEIISVAFFTLVINMLLLELLDLMFDELYIPLFLPLLYTALIIWGLGVIFGFFLNKSKY